MYGRKILNFLKLFSEWTEVQSFLLALPLRLVVFWVFIVGMVREGFTVFTNADFFSPLKTFCASKYVLYQAHCCAHTINTILVS